MTGWLRGLYSALCGACLIALGYVMADDGLRSTVPLTVLASFALVFDTLKESLRRREIEQLRRQIDASKG